MVNVELHGIVPVMVTPMTIKGEPDEDGIYRLADHFVKAGCGGAWVLGSASEDNNMSWDQIARVFKIAAGAFDGRIPIICGTGTRRVDDTLRFLEDCAGLQVTGVHVLYFDHKQGDRRVIGNIIRLADKSPYPIWLYTNPKRGKQITNVHIRELRDHPNIHGIKNGSYVLREQIEALMLEQPGFQVIGASGFQFFSALALGARAHTASSAGCWPEEYVALYKEFKSGLFEAARARQFRLSQLEWNLPRTDNGESAAEEKYILSLRGICGEYCNPAYRLLTGEEKEKARRLVRDFGFAWAK